MKDLASKLLSLWRREWLITAWGLLGILLAAICAVGAWQRGSWDVPPEGQLLEAAKFAGAVGIYFLTLALLLPLSGFSAPAHRRWVIWTIVIGTYFYGIEIIQAFRGIDPRFSQAGGRFDAIAGSVFGVTALVTIALFSILARQFFRGHVLVQHPALRTGIRYGSAAVSVAFVIGIVMTTVRSRYLGAGNMMPLHAAGFHGLQAVPLVALVAGSSTLNVRRAIGLARIAGISWLALCAGLLWQALAGHDLLAPALSTLVAAIGLAGWAGSLLYALRAHQGARTYSTTSRDVEPMDR